MGFRFRKSIKILPGVRVNLGKSGVSSVSVGPRGSTVTAGKSGVRHTIGLPGTGLSWSHRLTSRPAGRAAADSIEAPAAPLLEYDRATGEWRPATPRVSWDWAAGARVLLGILAAGVAIVGALVLALTKEMLTGGGRRRR